MNYIEKLIQFNSTDKYYQELKFLHSLIGSEYQSIMDYGCGIGTAIRYLNSRTPSYLKGFDIEQFMPEFDYCLPQDEVDTVYFMHSFAHIKEIDSVLKSINTKRVVVITPNALWINAINNEKYTPDPTVFRHYSLSGLHQVFERCGYKIIQSGQFGSLMSEQNERLFLIAEK